MGNEPASIPMRALCAVGAVGAAVVAVSIAVTGEFRSKGNVYDLPMWARCLIVGVMGLMAAVSGWVAVRGRA